MMENRTENRTEHEIETGIIYAFYTDFRELATRRIQYSLLLLILKIMHDFHIL